MARRIDEVGAALPASALLEVLGAKGVVSDFHTTGPRDQASKYVHSYCETVGAINNGKRNANVVRHLKSFGGRGWTAKLEEGGERALPWANVAYYGPTTRFTWV